MKINVAHVAKLANLPLTGEEMKKFEKQLSAILEYVEQLQKVDTSKIQETSQVTGLENVLREDNTSKSLSQKEALLNAPAIRKGFIKVKAILEE